MANLETFVAFQAHFHYFFYFITKVYTILFHVTCPIMLWLLVSFFLRFQSNPIILTLYRKMLIFNKIPENFSKFIFLLKTSNCHTNNHKISLQTANCWLWLSPTLSAKRGSFYKGIIMADSEYILWSWRRKVNPLYSATSDLH